MGLLPGWPYRDQITISGASNAGTYYPVRIIVGESSGSPGVDIHVGGFCTDFPNDIRFTADDGTTELFHWLEGLSGTTPNQVAIFWVLISANLSSNQDIYIYCGRSGFSSASNPHYTFRLFENVDSYQTTSRVSKASLISGSGSYAWMKMVDLGTGVWVMTYGELPDTVSSADHIHVRFSEDEGATWTADDTFTDGNPVSGFPIDPPDANHKIGNGPLILCPNGDILAIIGRAVVSPAGRDQAHVYRSTDGGASWSDEGTPFASNFVSMDDWIIDGSDIYLGGWWEPVYGGPNYDSRVYKSSDNGATWSLQGVIVTNTTDEVALAQIGSTSLLAVLRGGTGTATYTCISTDMGATWGSVTDVTDQLNIFQGQRMQVLEDGTIYLFGRFNTGDSNLYDITALFVSYDNGTYWHGPFAIDPLYYTYTGYPALLKRSTGSWYCLCDGGDLTSTTMYAYVFTDDPPYPAAIEWIGGANMAVSVSGDYLRFLGALGGSAYQGKFGVTAPGRRLSLEARYYNVSLGTVDQIGFYVCDIDTTKWFSMWYAPYKTAQSNWYYNAAGPDFLGGGWTEGSEFIMQAVIIETNLASGISYARRNTSRTVQDSQTGKANPAGSPSHTNRIVIGTATGTANCDARVLWILMRKHTGVLATEPAFNTDGGTAAVVYTGVPVVRTDPMTSLATTTATANGNITDDGNSTNDERGFVYGLTSKSDPGDVAPASSGYDSYVTEPGSFGTGAFTGSLTGLTANKIYYLRAYSHNSSGYAYGGQIVFLTDANGNILLPNGEVSTGIRFDTSPGGGWNSPGGGTYPHWLICRYQDSSWASGYRWGILSGLYVYEHNYYNDNYFTDLFELSNPTRQEEGIVKIKWKAFVIKNGYPYGNYKRELVTHSTQYTGTATAIPSGAGSMICEIFYTNPNTSAAWTLAEVNALQAGITLGKAGGYGVAACDYVAVYVLWANASATADSVTDIGGGQYRLSGTVAEDESESCSVYFEWGATASYGNTTASQSKVKGDTFTADITASGAIHYRAVIETACGETFYSADAVFSPGADDDIHIIP